MSNPNKTLSHRHMLPLEKRNKSQDNLSNNENTYSKISNISSKNPDYISENSVTNYLLDNPNFLETFLLKHHSEINLFDIVNKLSTTNAYSMTTSNTNTAYALRTMDFTADMTYSLPVPLSRMSEVRRKVDCSSKQSLHKSEQNDNSESQDFLKIEIPCRESPLSKTKSYENIVFQHLPKLSQKYLAPIIGIEEPVDMKRNTIQLLQDMKKDLISILHCDGANLYMIDNEKQIIYLDDLTRMSSIQKIEMGTTLAAYVACTKTAVRTQDILKDDRFPVGILKNNPFMKAALAQPVILNTGEPIGVMELYRSADKLCFSVKDEEIFQNYCLWASLAIYYNEINLNNQKQQKLNKFLLHVTQHMFGKFESSHLIIKEIMASAKSLVHADRVTLFLLDKDTNELSARIFDKGNFEECIFETNDDEIRFKLGEGVAGIVAETGQTLNIHDAYSDERFNRNIDYITGYVTKTILCMPVKLKTEIIGVAQMLNKKNGLFTENDETDFETFATYCGLALHISKMYEKILRSQQKYKVALDVLSYHNGYSVEEFQKLKYSKIPDCIDNIHKLSFWPWTVDIKDQPMHVIYMFRDLFGLELFDGETLMRFVLTIKKNYRKVAYHNWNHAFSVAHSMYSLLKTCKYDFNLYESLALFIGCLCHDLDHRGKTNEFMAQNAAPLSVLYSTSTMEHHHFNMTITILQRDGHNIFSHLSPHNYKKLLGNIKHCILATDLAKYFEYRTILESSPDYKNTESSCNRLLHMALSMTFCDLCAMYKSWDMQLTLVMIIMQEFWTQGDEEKSKGRIPMRLMDRSYKFELPDSQVGFLTHVCIPCYKLVGGFMPEVYSVVKEAENNLEKWTHLSSLPEKEKVNSLKKLEIYVEKFITENKLYVR